jgi:hypothetical protein
MGSSGTASGIYGIAPSDLSRYRLCNASPAELAGATDKVSAARGRYYENDPYGRDVRMLVLVVTRASASLFSLRSLRTCAALPCFIMQIWTRDLCRAALSAPLWDKPRHPLSSQ